LGQVATTPNWNEKRKKKKVFGEAGLGSAGEKQKPHKSKEKRRLKNELQEQGLSKKRQGRGGKKGQKSTVGLLKKCGSCSGKKKEM